jgi:hypothetical protein
MISDSGCPVSWLSQRLTATLKTVTASCPVSETGASGNLRDGHLREALLDEELEGGALQPFPRVRLPATHPAVLTDDTTCYGSVV